MTVKEDLLSFKSTQDSSSEDKKGCRGGIRYILVVMLFLAKFNVYSTRSSLSVVIVAMVGIDKDKPVSNSTADECPYPNTTAFKNQSEPVQEGQFDWNTAQQGLALGAYYYGYTVTNLVGGYITHKFGFKAVIAFATLTSGILTAISPLIARAGLSVFVAARVLLGLLQGPVTPSLTAAVGVWIPHSEITSVMGVIFAGGSAGTLVTLPLAGYIAETLGWEVVFYITGGFACIWVLAWALTVYDSPHSHPWITAREKQYIMRKKRTVVEDKGNVKVPWFALLTSMSFWAPACGYITNNWGVITSASFLPTYLSSVLHFNIAQSGIYSAVPYLLQFFILISAGIVSDVVRKTRLASTLTVRKFNSFLCLVVPAVFSVLATYVGCQPITVVALFSLSVGFFGCTATSHEPNLVDISPRFSGVCMGIMTGLSSIPGFLAPYVAGIILTDTGSIESWRIVFWIVFGIHTFGFLIFMVFASSEKQPWDEGKTKASDRSLLRKKSAEEQKV